MWIYGLTTMKHTGICHTIMEQLNTAGLKRKTSFNPPKKQIKHHCLKHLG